jgi:hypothetical protein
MSDPTSIGEVFCRALRETIVNAKPKRLIETGTYTGLGSTQCLLAAMRENNNGARLVTVEANPGIYAVAIKNLKKDIDLGVVSVIHGHSLPASRIKSVEQMVSEMEDNGYEPDEAQREANHCRKCGHFPGSPFDRMKVALSMLEGGVDFALLDGNGYGGTDEFLYLLDIAKPPFIVALDDTKAIKHSQTVDIICKDSRFEVLSHGDDRWGHLIAEYR